MSYILYTAAIMAAALLVLHRTGSVVLAAAAALVTGVALPVIGALLLAWAVLAAAQAVINGRRAAGQQRGRIEIRQVHVGYDVYGVPLVRNEHVFVPDEPRRRWWR